MLTALKSHFALLAFAAFSTFTFVTPASAFPNLPTLVFPSSNSSDEGNVTKGCSGMNQTCPEDG